MGKATEWVRGIVGAFGREAPSPRDVPCESCQDSYPRDGFPHFCESPRYCPCEYARFHHNAEVSR